MKIDELIGEIQELETIKNDEFFCNLSNEDYIGFILNKMEELEEDK